MNSACDRPLKQADGAVSLLGPQNVRCKTPVSQRAFPHKCSTCHALNPKAGGRCTKEAATKSAYCTDHVYLDDDHSASAHKPATAAHAPVTAPETPPKSIT